MSASLVRVLRAAAAMLALGTTAGTLGVVACDPCSGVIGCDGAARVSVSGQLVDRVSGRPARGVRVDVTPSAGSPAFAPLSATTDGDGLWHVEGPAPAGDLRADVTIAPSAPGRTYHVRRLPVHGSTRRGDGSALGRWVTDPVVRFLGEVRFRQGNGPIVGAGVVFRRTGGTGTAPQTQTLVTDSSGRFLVDVQPPDGADVDDVVGDIAVVIPGLTPAGGRVFANTRFRVRYRDEPVQVDGVFPVGLWLTYTGEIYFRGTGASLANTDITFRRTGGIGISPSLITTRSDAAGRFLLAPAPLTDGEVIGELSFTPPRGTAPVVIRDVRFSTYDSLETRLLRVGYGERLAYAGELQSRGTYARAAGVPVEFRRTGGIEIMPSVLRGVTDAYGRFPIIADVQDSGTVVGDVVADPDGPRRHVFSGVRLRTFAADELRFAQVWVVGDGIFYAGELFDRATGARAAGLTAQFVRTGGMTIEPAMTTGRSDGAGRFLIAASASAAGIVVGDVVVQGPNGFTTRVRDVRLATQRDDSLRLAGVWGVGPSLLYDGEILNGANDARVVGARITFERTGGIVAAPARIDAVTSAAGRFPLHLTTTQSGDVVGTLTIRPPAPWAGDPIVIPDVHVPTFDGDEQRLLAVWRIPPPGP